ncbi:conserved hypothetical protein [Ricinus communis]|uniref:Uncharacterized protein n=1 Tax=Ricinus communis TaxID=3988 RepID=B9T194_RICCO|nr:conserved hypothetical protein [Ricinus communis]
METFNDIFKNDPFHEEAKCEANNYETTSPPERDILREAIGWRWLMEEKRGCWLWCWSSKNVNDQDSLLIIACSPLPPLADLMLGRVLSTAWVFTRLLFGLVAKNLGPAVQVYPVQPIHSTSVLCDVLWRLSISGSGR